MRRLRWNARITRRRIKHRVEVHQVITIDFRISFCRPSECVGNSRNRNNRKRKKKHNTTKHGTPKKITKKRKKHVALQLSGNGSAATSSLSSNGSCRVPSSSEPEFGAVVNRSAGTESIKRPKYGPIPEAKRHSDFDPNMESIKAPPPPPAPPATAKKTKRTIKIE